MFFSAGQEDYLLSMQYLYRILDELHGCCKASQPISQTLKQRWQLNSPGETLVLKLVKYDRRGPAIHVQTPKDVSCDGCYQSLPPKTERISQI